MATQSPARPNSEQGFSIPWDAQVAAGVALVAVVILASFGYDQWRGDNAALAKAGRETRNAARLLAEDTAQIFESIAKTLHAVAALHADVVAGRYQDKAIIQSLLKAIAGGSEVLGAIGWVDRDGNWVASSPDQMMMRDNAATSLARRRERCAPFSAAAMREIKSPTLLINGARSAPFFHAIANAVLKHIAGARRVVIEGAGHAMNVERPGAFNAAALDFLANP